MTIESWSMRYATGAEAPPAEIQSKSGSTCARASAGEPAIWMKIHAERMNERPTDAHPMKPLTLSEPIFYPAGRSGGTRQAEKGRDTPPDQQPSCSASICESGG